ncbi:hypothetical protein MC7420_2146 [Coleofasciculus chthonoplastes PCC 7420]|uniref:Uncharacterized protein n=1 Tax=Coleofasciculus chthonoplastes PCC 7420 TaxID=118168 RepID=B4VSP3_9CYAN|nr:hypothetical protein MC7420_2146 [Coleofasciculus chthonoplastes PCC 7420]
MIRELLYRFITLFFNKQISVSLLVHKNQKGVKLKSEAIKLP